MILIKNDTPKVKFEVKLIHNLYIVSLHMDKFIRSLTTKGQLLQKQKMSLQIVCSGALLHQLNKKKYLIFPLKVKSNIKA